MNLSVIVPAYNRAALLAATLESLLRQTVPADEIIVVDDGSTDGTERIAESFGNRVQVVRQENRGPAAARNRGFAESSGEFIHFFDSDDIAVPNKHEVQLQALEESGADIAYGPWIKGRLENSAFRPINEVYQQKGLPGGDLIEALLGSWSVVPHACLFRRSVVEQSGGFPEDLFGTEDQLMFLRCLLAGAKVVHSPGTLELYRADNEDKITSIPSGFNRHLVEWGRFIVAAREECLARGIDPSKWLLFQMRAHGTWKELRGMEFDGREALLGELRKLFKDKRAVLYRLYGLTRQKYHGLQNRLVGRRGSAAFRMGKLSNVQIRQIEAAGYTLQH